MSKYKVLLETGASMAVTVEADTPEQAVEEALNEHSWTSPCHQEPFELGDWDVSDAEDAVEEIDT